MRYLGGKWMIASWVAWHILRLRGSREHYLEPFFGSGSIVGRVAAHFETITVADAHPDLILMWQAIQRGWVPPDNVSRELWFFLKKQPPSALRGFVGFGSAYSGKFLGGYASGVAHTAKESCLRVAATLRAESVTIVHSDYAAFTPDTNTFVYCDPPYASTNEYKGTKRFDSAKFWRTAQTWAESGVRVVVSEETAPPGWQPLATKFRRALMRNQISSRKEKSSHTRERKEVLWHFGDLPLMDHTDL